MGLIAHDSTSRLFRQAAKLVRTPVDSLLEIGPGIRPQNLVSAMKTIFAEPHWEYVSRLQLDAANAEILQCDGLAALELIERVDTIIALDVIEHMERADGELFLAGAKEKADQVIIFTPLGFVEQSGGTAKDPWGLQGQKWQRHRSGWEPRDFPGWKVIVDEHFHVKLHRGAFIAVWN